MAHFNSISKLTASYGRRCHRPRKARAGAATKKSSAASASTMEGPAAGVEPQRQVKAAHRATRQRLLGRRAGAAERRSHFPRPARGEEQVQDQVDNSTVIAESAFALLRDLFQNHNDAGKAPWIEARCEQALFRDDEEAQKKVRPM